MGRGLMVRVVRLVLDRLRIDEPVQKQRADDDEEGDGFPTESRHDTTRVNGTMLVDTSHRCQDGGAARSHSL